MKRVDGRPRVGEVIAVSVPEQARTRYGYPPTVIHRVVRVAPDGRITTKGDARREVDPFTVGGGAVEAKVATTVPAAGRALAFLTSTLGLLWLAAGVLMLVAMPLVERQRELQRRGHEGVEELRGDVHALVDELARLQYEVSAQAHSRAALEDRLSEVADGAIAAQREATQAAAELPELPERIEAEIARAVDAAGRHRRRGRPGRLDAARTARSEGLSEPGRPPRARLSAS